MKEFDWDTARAVDMQEICNLLIDNGYRLVRVRPAAGTEGAAEGGNPFDMPFGPYDPRYGKSRKEDDPVLQKELDRARRRAEQQKFEEYVGRPELVADLKKWRLGKAREENVPTYIILGNMVLLRIAEKAPSNMEELMNVKGFGQAKAQKFGPDILDIVARSMEEA